jgi:hypothetical protein
MQEERAAIAAAVQAMLSPAGAAAAGAGRRGTRNGGDSRWRQAGRGEGLA